jgi:hypothetical protein
MKKIVESYSEFIMSMNEDLYSAKKKYGNEFSDDFYNYVSNHIKNKHYIDWVCYIFTQSIINKENFDTVQKVINNVEYYIETKTYLTFDFEKEHVSLDMLVQRNKAMRNIKEILPKNFLRNNKEIRGRYKLIDDRLGYMIGVYGEVLNKKKNVLNKINNIISASNKTIDEIIDLLEDKYNLDSIDEPITLEDIENISEFTDGEIDSSAVTKLSDTIYMIKIDSFEALIEIGKSSYWCHTYKGGESNYNTYTYYGETYMFVNLEYKDADHMLILTAKFYNALNNGDIEEAFELYDEDRESYDEKVNEDEYGGLIFDKYNNYKDDVVSVLKYLFNNKSYEEIYELIEL